MKSAVPLALICVVLGGAKGDATTFSFLGGGPFDGVDLSTRPGLTTNGITLTAVSATSPSCINETRLGESIPATLVCSNRVGVNNSKISNVDYITQAGASDLSAESVVMNFLETMTFYFDRSEVFSPIRVTDLGRGAT